jgi:DNA-binding NtrC family response regulator
MNNARILIVDDEKNIRLSLTQALGPLGYAVETAMNGEEGLEKIADRDLAIVILDLRMPGMDGMEVLRRIAERRPDVRVIITTAYGTIERAVEAMMWGRWISSRSLSLPANSVTLL